MGDSSIEGNTSALKLIRETMRQFPAIDMFRRTSIREPLDLGEYGKVPAGSPFSVLFASNGYDMGEDFDPARWTGELSKAFVHFGGHIPHYCAGKNLALLEIQVLTQLLVTNYKLEVLDSEIVVSELLGASFRDGLRVKVTRAEEMTRK